MESKIKKQEPIQIDLYTDEKVSSEEINIDDSTQWVNIITDNTIPNSIRIEVLQNFFKQKENDTIELINKITGIYQFSGSKIVANFLFLIATESNLSSFLKLECAKSLLSFEEMEEIIYSHDDEQLNIIKKESNLEIQERNKERKSIGFQVLNIVCHTMSDIPTPCCIEAVFLLMCSDDYTEECSNYLCSILSDEEIDCDYRYKILLSLEKQSEIKNKDLYLYNGLFCFLLFDKNRTMYRILSAQYLLQKITLEEDDIEEIENIILSFANDEELDYDLRADASDLLLSLGSPQMKVKGREIINHLAQLKGIVRTIFDNAQNVHTVEIENSVIHILEFLSEFPVSKNNGIEIDFNFINSKIEKTLEEIKFSFINNSHYDSVNELLERNQFSDFCEYCGRGVLNKVETKNFCSNECALKYKKEENIRLSLNRIYMDRLLYSKFNLTLNHILIKIYSYMLSQTNYEEIYKRLLEELQDMSGTCSSGFTSRLVNVLSGFGEFNIRISFTDQIISNFAGRLNARIKKITESNSIFLNERLNDVVELFVLSNDQLYNRVKNDIKENTGHYPTSKTEIINQFLKENRDEKINECLTEFQINVLNEITIESSSFNERKNFMLFLRSNISSIQTELFEEFKNYVSDTDFDLAFRRAIYNYEGCNY